LKIKYLRLTLMNYSIYFVALILNILVPHTEHLPLTAGLPFFIFISLTSTISDFFLHFMQ
jgi:hypothetical protein